jgi:hypothetical protein
LIHGFFEALPCIFLNKIGVMIGAAAAAPVWNPHKRIRRLVAG